MGWRAARMAAVGVMVLGALVVPWDGIALAAEEKLPAGAEWKSVTLVTGDRVEVASGSDGRSVARVRPGAGRAGMTFLRRERGRSLSIIPGDAAGLVMAGKLDSALFDVTALLADGHGDTAQTDVPLVMSYSGDPVELAGAKVGRRLRAVGGAAVTEQKARAGEFWKALRRGRAELAPGVGKVWLDGKVHADLDVSVPRIGAPKVWQAGYTGSGTTVAVLDSGIDATHPDLVGAVAGAKDFTGSANGTADEVGHGTHVASIITGGDSAAAGTYKGVAPDAKLLVGKVLDSGGQGSFSQLIAGMEWAAGQHARIVNLSLGGSIKSDGTDPVSLAVNRLSEQTGTLFVVAAGNRGYEGEGTVGLPAVADAALTVGAVDKDDDAVAGFSSSGPRDGDSAIKPDITAPGTDIVAARATGSGLGEPVGEGYMRLSGTSMAAPHVAGAAALLAQEHPDWTGTRIKSALMNTARPNGTNTVFRQGAGLIDVPAAAGQTVAADTASVSVQAEDAAVTRTVTFRNEGAEPVTLDLKLALAGAPDGLVTLDTTSLRIEAGAKATATLTVDPAKGEPGRYSGYLTARGISIPVAVTRQPALHTIAVSAIDLNGADSGESADTLPYVEVYNLDTMEYGRAYISRGRLMTKVPAGRYDVSVVLSTQNADGMMTGASLFSYPDVTVAGDVAITADARKTSRVTATVDSPTAQTLGAAISVKQETPTEMRLVGIEVQDPSVVFTALPTAPVTDRPYVFYHGVTKTEPKADGRAYHLVFDQDGKIPEDLRYRVHDRDLATVKARYHNDLPLSGTTVWTMPTPPGLTFGLGGAGEYPVNMPGTRTVLYSPIEGGSYRRYLAAKDAFDLNQAEPVLKAGTTTTENWNSAALGSIAVATRFCATCTTSFGVDPFQSTGAKWQIFAGVKQTFDDAPGTLHETATRTSTWTRLGTRAEGTWTYDAAKNPTGAPSLLVTRVTGAFDLRNAAPYGRPFKLTIRGELNTMWKTTVADLTAATVQASFDDGATWKTVETSRTGTDIWTARVVHPRRGTGTGFVSLRVQATDGSGITADTTTIRSYALN